MRLPLPIVFLLSIGVVSATWWSGTKDHDFLTAPGVEKLAMARQRAAKIGGMAPLPKEFPLLTNSRGSTVPEPIAPEPPKEPEFNLGSLETVPGLEAYAVDSQQGADHLIRLATALETKGSFQRALLAWERIVDLGKADAGTQLKAIESIKRLRPTLPSWNIDPEGAIPLILHAGTGPAAAPALKPLLGEVANLIGEASDGVVVVTAEIAVGKKAVEASGPAPVAVWFSGPAKDSPSSEVLSFTLSEPAGLRDQVLRTVYKLVSAQLNARTAYSAPLILQSTEDPLDALTHRVTRLCWREMAAALNLPPRQPAPAVPVEGEPRRRRNR